MSVINLILKKNPTIDNIRSIVECALNESSQSDVQSLKEVIFLVNNKRWHKLESFRDELIKILNEKIKERQACSQIINICNRSKIFRQAVSNFLFSKGCYFWTRKDQIAYHTKKYYSTPDILFYPDSTPNSIKWIHCKYLKKDESVKKLSKIKRQMKNYQMTIGLGILVLNDEAVLEKLDFVRTITFSSLKSSFN